jgi:hypothetical protein
VNHKGRLLRWSLLFGVGIPLALVVLEASPLGPNPFYVLLGIPALSIAWAAACICSGIACASALKRRAWRQVLAAGVLPVALLIAAPDPLRFVRPLDHAGDIIHFALARPGYDRQIAALPANVRPRVVVFDWGGMVWSSRGVVYDESDQVALPPGRRSAAWLAQTSHTELACGYGVQPLWAHYYLASFPC